MDVLANGLDKMVNTHTFNGRKYKIEIVASIDGVTDVPGEPDPYTMLILSGNDLKALHSAMHEALEALGFCDKCLHRYEARDDGRPVTWDAARFLKRPFGTEG